MNNKMNSNKLYLKFKIKTLKIKTLKDKLNKFTNKTSRMICKCKMIFLKIKKNNKIKKSLKLQTISNLKCQP
jgi:hypothetical protein